MEFSLLDRFLLALAIWREARGESDTGMLLVGLVILNRALDGKHRWPRRVAEVILQPQQFSAFNPDDPNALLWPRDRDPTWKRAERAALAAIEASADPTFRHPAAQANHYHATSVQPRWATAEPLHTEDRHVFYRL